MKEKKNLLSAILLIGGILILLVTILASKTGFLTATPGIGSSMVREIDGMEMMYVPEGYFLMGYDDGYDDEKPMQETYVDAFWIDQHEVTTSQYALCVNSGSCAEPHSMESNTRSNYYGNDEYADFPVIFVDWYQAQDYCEWAGGSLPTEAQWEKAARGTDGRIYPWGGEKPTCDLVNFEGCVGDTTRVGSYPLGASPYGVMDMTGNVYEWLIDWYDPFIDQKSDEDLPTEPTERGCYLVYGGSWYSSDDFISLPTAHWCSQFNTDTYGFRCVYPAAEQ